MGVGSMNLSFYVLRKKQNIMAPSYLERFFHLFGRDLTLAERRSLASSRSSLQEDGANEIFLHASRQGIGLIYKHDGRWLAWTFVEGSPAIQNGADGGIDLLWAELTAVELGLLTFISDPFFASPPLPSASSSSLSNNIVLVIRSDNKVIKNAFKRRPWKSHLNPNVTRILDKAKNNGLKLKVKRVGPKENPAGGPSCGDYPSPELMLGWVPDEEEVEMAGLRGALKVVGMASETSSLLSFRSTLAEAGSDGVDAIQKIFVDASKKGIGLVYKNDGRWLAWTFVEGHPAIQKGANGKIDSSWSELIAAELALLTLLADPSMASPTFPSGSSSSLAQKRVLEIKSDNRGVVKAIRRGSWNTRLEAILGRIFNRAEQNNVEIRVRWLWTRSNPADKPSRGEFPPREMMLEWAPPDVDVEAMGLRRVL